MKLLLIIALIALLLTTGYVAIWVAAKLTMFVAGLISGALVGLLAGYVMIRITRRS